jgi:hypothetical protein
MPTYKLTGPLFIVLSILIVLGCRTTVGKPCEPGELDANGQLRVIERERLESLLQESEFSLSDLADSSNAAEIGKLLGVDTGEILATATSTQTKGRHACSS